ncbi:MAG: extracellular solute-binding protein [Lachnospiraceae bacterium]
MKKQLSLLMAAAIAAAAMSGCSGSGNTAATTAAKTEAADGQATQEEKTEAPAASGESIRVAWWGNQKRADATIAAFDAFAKESGVNFTYEYNSYDAYWETLATQSVGNNLPGIVQQVTDQYAGYINNGLLLDLTPYVESGALDLSDCDEAYISGGNYKDGLYGVSLGTNVMTIMYNADLFEAAGVEPPKMGWTWSDFVQTARDIYAKTGVQTENIALGMPRYLLEPMIRSKGQSLYSEDGKGFGFDDTDEGSDRAGAPGLLRSDPGGRVCGSRRSAPLEGQLRARPVHRRGGDGPELKLQFSNFSGYYNQNLEMTTQPLFDGATEKGMYLRPAQFFSVTKDCPDPEAAAKAISFFINDKGANEILNGEREFRLPRRSARSLRARPATRRRKFTTSWMWLWITAATQIRRSPPPPDSAWKC